jgi:hypothetical protein
VQEHPESPIWHIAWLGGGDSRKQPPINARARVAIVEHGDAVGVFG